MSMDETNRWLIVCVLYPFKVYIFMSKVFWSFISKCSKSTKVDKMRARLPENALFPLQEHNEQCAQVCMFFQCCFRIQHGNVFHDMSAKQHMSVH